MSSLLHIFTALYELFFFAGGVPDVQKLGEEGNQIEKRNQSSFEGNYRHILRLIRKASFSERNTDSIP